MSRLFIVFALLAMACGSDSRGSPFVDGTPSADVQEQFLAACQLRRDKRDAGEIYSTVGSLTPERSATPDPSGSTRCSVSLTWRGNRITSLSVIVNNGPFFDEFLRRAVLPLLKDRAADVVREELLHHLASGPREKKFTTIQGGGTVETELRWGDGERGPFLAAAELLISRR